MNLDDFLFDDVSMGLFEDEIFEDPRLRRYDPEVKEQLNVIARYDFDFSLSFMEYLARSNVKIGSRVAKSVATNARNFLTE